MFLGALGILIGTIGLGIVLLRNILERKNELALLMATGFRKQQLFRLVFIENFFLLSAGLIIGIISAFIAIFPSLVSPAYIFPGLFILVLIVIIFINGVVWIYFPVRKSMKENLIISLRSE